MLSLNQGYKYNKHKISLSLSITGLYIQQNKSKGKPLDMPSENLMYMMAVRNENAEKR